MKLLIILLLISSTIQAQTNPLAGFDTHVTYYTKNIILFAGKNPADGNISKHETGQISFSNSNDSLFMTIEPDVGYKGLSGTFNGYIHSKNQNVIVFYFFISGEYNMVYYRKSVIIRITSYPMGIKREVIYYLSKQT